jgi:drug/metabolite transporter (DMT)-like permease
MIFSLCILVRIVANPFSNVFQKLLTRHGANPLFIICAVLGLLTLFCIPIFLIDLPALSREFWWTMAVCSLFTVSGNVLIVHAVKRSDLSVLGPINAYKSVVSLVPGIIFLNEIPGPMGLSGIVLIVAGSYFLVDRDANHPKKNAFVRFLQERGVQYRFAALVFSAIEAIVLKRALLISSASATFAFWSTFGFVLSLAFVLLTIRGQDLAHEMDVVRSRKATYLFLFATTGLMQYTTIVVFAGFQVGYALALFQMSTIVSVFLGWRIFREKHFLKRLAGSAIMVVGALLIILGNQ